MLYLIVSVSRSVRASLMFPSNSQSMSVTTTSVNWPASINSAGVLGGVGMWAYNAKEVPAMRTKPYWHAEYAYWRAVAIIFGCAWVPKLGHC